jgi:hypothetical protein
MDDLFHLAFVQTGTHRNGEVGPRCFFCTRQVPISELRHRRLAVDGHSVVHARLDAGLVQPRDELVGTLVAHDVQVPRRLAAGRRLRQLHEIA